MFAQRSQTSMSASPPLGVGDHPVDRWQPRAGARLDDQSLRGEIPEMIKVLHAARAAGSVIGSPSCRFI
jgi:hypothetical protein